MSHSNQKSSNKLNIIDRSTFENIQQDFNCSPNIPKTVIRNSKFKHTRSNFNLLQFLTIKTKQKFIHRRAAEQSHRLGNPKKIRGKTRECGRKTHYSRLKKSILRYRKKKLAEERIVGSIYAVTETLSGLQLEPNPTNDIQLLPNAADVDATAKERESSAVSESINNALACNSGIHSRRFRDYCDNCTTTRLCQLTEELLRELNRFQRRAFAVKELKARAHRRLVLGFREVQNFMIINKIKLIILATDCEECKGEDGLDDTISALKKQCQDKQIPYVFALQRRKLAYALYKKVPVSCVGILDYDGARELYANLLEELHVARQNYLELLQSKQTANHMELVID